MKRMHRWLPLLLVTVVPGLLAATANQPSGTPIAASDAPALSAERMRTVGRAIGFDTWPRPETLFVAPSVSRELLAIPAQVDRAVRACTPVRFAGEPWGRCDWSWRGSDQPDSSLDLSITLAPSSQAAQEYLLATVSDNMLPAEAAAATLSTAERPASLGDVAFVVSARGGRDLRIDFARSNLAVRIRARGRLANDAPDAARRIDAQVQDQRPLSTDELMARRPRLMLGTSPQRGVLPYRLTVPGTRPVVAVRASDGRRSLVAANGSVVLGEAEDAPSSVVILAITADLLAAEATVELPRKC